MNRRAFVFLAAMTAVAQPADPGAARTYLVKLSVPVGTKLSKAGDAIKAAIISPESLLNGYLEGIVEERSAGRIVLRFNRVQYKSKATPIRSEVIGFVNSKGHKEVDDDERPIRLQDGAFLIAHGDLWLDEGSELRVRAEPPK